MTSLSLMVIAALFLRLVMTDSHSSVALAAPNSRLKYTCTPGRVVKHQECCKWFEILDDMQENLFENECGPEAHESLRAMFHDAIGYSRTGMFNGTYAGGGADGSIMFHAEVELAYKANVGLDEIIYPQRNVALKHDVSFGDIIHFAGAVGLTNCGGGPRLQFFAGRPNTSEPAPDYMVPAPFHTADQIFERMADAGFQPDEVVQLMTAHTVAAQHSINPGFNSAPLDSTPQDFDGQFFVETLLRGTEPAGNGTEQGEASSPLPGEFRLQSDVLLARDPRSACEWQSMINHHEVMIAKFERVMTKLTTLGQDRGALIDCSDVIPGSSRLNHEAMLPAGKTMKDIEPACALIPFPSLSTVSGPVKSLAPVRHKYAHH
uniref:Peroxidase n=1 Tax=Cerrena unicolor TaxID=90312 RepID=I3W7F0_CERUI|nr:manganese peroxidase 2 [Cerrena unicolor]AFR51951.1 manganese peroxidase 2 [Cerrena unicolor]